jgi:CRP/FNR family transcriptional regulator, cyclic AMP receptor protein
MTGTPAMALADHAFVRGMSPDHVARLADAAAAVSVPAGHRFFEEGGNATRFWLVTAGHVALDLRKPGQADLIVETLGGGDVLGLSWLSPPYEWQFGAVAVEATAAFELDGQAVIALCDSRPEFGYQITRRMAAVASRRLHGTRIRLLDLYGTPAQGAGAR